jgi:transposase-like protein
VAKSDLQNPVFHDDDKAREAFEGVRWPNGPVCPHCGNLDQEKIAKGNGKIARPGLYYCAACNGQFTVTVGSVMERSKIPLSKWLLAMHLMGASKKGISALQLQRMLGVTYKSAWFMCHRIRAVTTPAHRGPIGGQNRVVEAMTHSSATKRRIVLIRKKTKKHAVLALVDRDGESYSFHIANATAKTLRPIIAKAVDSNSYLAADELASYVPIGRYFAGHGTVNHSANECTRLGSFIHANTPECRFSLMKRRFWYASFNY